MELPHVHLIPRELSPQASAALKCAFSLEGGVGSGVLGCLSLVPWLLW